MIRIFRPLLCHVGAYLQYFSEHGQAPRAATVFAAYRHHPNFKEHMGNLPSLPDLLAEVTELVNRDQNKTYDMDLTDKVAEILRLPFPRQRLSASEVRKLGEHVLRPDEPLEMRIQCLECHEFIQEPAIVFVHGAARCLTCSADILIPCRYAGCTTPVRHDMFTVSTFCPKHEAEIRQQLAGPPPDLYDEHDGDDDDDDDVEEVEEVVPDPNHVGIRVEPAAQPPHVGPAIVHWDRPLVADDVLRGFAHAFNPRVGGNRDDV